jgi:hypothetical protein
MRRVVNDVVVLRIVGTAAVTAADAILPVPVLLPLENDEVADPPVRLNK